MTARSNGFPRRLEHLGHHVSGSEELGFDGAKREVELFRNLFVALLLEIPQFNQTAIAVFQLLITKEVLPDRAVLAEQDMEVELVLLYQQQPVLLIQAVAVVVVLMVLLLLLEL